LLNTCYVFWGRYSFYVKVDTLASQSGQRLHGTGGFLNAEKIVNTLSLQEGMKIADFGSGTGYFTILIGKEIGKQGIVYALDVQEMPLEAVQNKAKIEGLTNVEAIRANLEVIGGSSLPDNSQDMVLMANILFQSSQKTDIVREGKRILKDGGRLVAIDWEKKSGGFGPPDAMRTESAKIKSLILDEGFTFERDIDAGKFHFGMIFQN